MNRARIKKIVLCAVLADIAVVGSMFSFPILGSRCAPIQHMVNIICAVFLGPGYGVACAFLASLLRNLFGLGSLNGVHHHADLAAEFLLAVVAIPSTLHTVRRDPAPHDFVRYASVTYKPHRD